MASLVCNPAIKTAKVRPKKFKEVAPEAEPTGSSKAAQGDGRGQAASPAASNGPLQPGLW
jgi:hypothetical protein